jgi:hypothetical protein
MSTAVGVFFYIVSFVAGFVGAGRVIDHKNSGVQLASGVIIFVFGVLIAAVAASLVR